MTGYILSGSIYLLFLESERTIPVVYGVISGGVTGGFGWVQTHPLSKKAPMRFSQIQRLFWGWGVGVGLREKKHELCQIVLNKQQHLHDAIIAFNFDH